jgi:uncharacterized protein YndB with AHSA1/START domain/ketosteroid isomerase-like protein
MTREAAPRRGLSTEEQRMSEPAERSTRVTRHVKAPRAAVYRALLDAGAVARWMVPDGMSSDVHAFDAREGGALRISLTYDEPTGAGKTTAHTDTYHGRLVRLVPDELVAEVLEFETDDPAMQGEMTITLSLADADGGTELVAVHDRLPPGLSAADNEVGWRMSLAKLAALVEAEAELRRLTIEWDRAMVSNDADAIGRFMTDDWTIIGPDGSVGTKARFLALVRSGALTHDVMESHEVDVRVYGDAAVVIARGISGGRYEGEAFLLVERVSSVFVREADGWRCMSTHLSDLA